MLNSFDIDNQLRALAEPTRRSMMERLSRGPESVSALAKPFNMSLTAIVQHLKVLEAAGLIKTEKIARVRTCQINPAGLQSIADWISERHNIVQSPLDYQGALLAAAQKDSNNNDQGDVNT